MEAEAGPEAELEGWDRAMLVYKLVRLSPLHSWRMRLILKLHHHSTGYVFVDCRGWKAKDLVQLELLVLLYALLALGSELVVIAVVVC